MPASLDGALIRNTEAEPQERRATMQRKKAVVPGVGKAKGKAEVCVRSWGWDTEARQMKIKRLGICTLEREGTCERTVGFHSAGAELTASVSCSHPRRQW